MLNQDKEESEKTTKVKSLAPTPTFTTPTFKSFTCKDRNKHQGRQEWGKEQGGLG